MGTILDQIIHEKRKFIKQLKEINLMKEPMTLKPNRSFIKDLQEAKEISIIAEFKRASPSKGIINANRKPLEQAKKYRQSGVDAVSVLTDEPFFQGSYQDLAVISQAIDVPVLCKDFIIDSIQIDLAKSNGADLILLIAAALTDDKLYSLYEYAKSKGLEVLMEVHNEVEAERVLKTDNLLIGINNRNLKTFAVDLSITETIAPYIRRAGRLVISESGMKDEVDVERVMKAGANGVLVGETFMKHPNVAEVISSMKLPLLEMRKR
ncbi:indole-3-glycerol phosphate synthase TrpC [Caldibacillus lycopersici]|uniref:Indole-3-glycerol phosphate synthase n=1 Tax=Perspicuibacillus lycopersici TaxID=1325689 RepID=A0AAE3LRR8_9BACI|nr:indole-3-glycerol phosphate synthase TrpC [Perspicuibacillus lycopersici]MCU9612028.1 indole-3-glycerol phosphate synthase TrpC [Perspicuibacillus lycopersici]